MIPNIKKTIADQKEFFETQKTKDISFRKEHLILLQKEVVKREGDVVRALYKDFKKSEYEVIITEISSLISELKRTISKLDSWGRPKKVWPVLINFPSSAKIYKEPYGRTLIISPWNYPYHLALLPLIGAIAAGNTVVLKPSELTPYTSTVIREIIEAVFDKKYVTVIEGGASVSKDLLDQRWDYIFFTGSVAVGKIVARAAANFLTPVTLELGGKSPCIIDETADIQLAAKRIVWGKFINAGQTCIAPDYLLVNKKIKKKFIKYFKQELKVAYGENPENSNDFPRIINEKNWERLSKMLQGQTILAGGKTNKQKLYISPTLIDEPTLESTIMSEEIFGPLLPLISYTKEGKLNDIISHYEKPLSFYIFSTDKKFITKIMNKYSFGGGVVNDTIMHVANHNLPFGGVGESGMGSYHGKFGFDSFSHAKSVVTRYNWLDMSIRYAPYTGKLKRLRQLMGLM
jgi:aldehyde dehydrogenase (NAD+)